MAKEIVFVYPNASLIAGVDEVGRGSLCGNVVAGAVILDKTKPISGLTDSKKLTENSRLHFFELIQNRALCWSIGRASAQEIDQLNILQATMLAMQRAVNNLDIKPNYVLVDGNQVPALSIPSQAIIKGDLLVAEISAASIMAKVTRDREMQKLDKYYPHYQLAKHKGYPTRDHLKAINQHGINEHYRRSFSPVKWIVLNKNRTT